MNDQLQTETNQFQIFNNQFNLGRIIVKKRILLSPIHTFNFTLQILL